MNNHMEGYEALIKEKFGTETIKALRGIEIGCFRGEWCSYMLSRFISLRMITIDPYLQWLEVLKNVGSTIDRLQIIQLKSDEAAKILEGMYDFVFIDGDHNYEQCRRDILNYMKFVKPGGLMSGHDFHKDPVGTHPGVHQAVEEIFKSTYKLQPDFIWYVEL